MATTKKVSDSDATEKAALQALDKIERAVAKYEAAQPVTAAVDLKQLCKVYQQAKPWIETALPLIGKIPVYGKPIAAAIRMMMQIADVACAF